jgi:hypothetical protein
LEFAKQQLETKENGRQVRGVAGRAATHLEAHRQLGEVHANDFRHSARKQSP